jgi:hypothetical protein
MESIGEMWDKVPPGDAGHPVCLDISIEIRLVNFTIVDMVLKHSPCCSPTLSASHGMFVSRPSSRCVLQPAKSMLPPLHTSLLSAAYGRYSVQVMSKVGLSDAL